jgi:hypothetical protein
MNQDCVPLENDRLRLKIKPGGSIQHIETCQLFHALGSPKK